LTQHVCAQVRAPSSQLCTLINPLFCQAAPCEVTSSGRTRVCAHALLTRRGSGARQAFGQHHFWAAELGPLVCIGLSTVRFRSNIFRRARGRRRRSARQREPGHEPEVFEVGMCVLLYSAVRARLSERRTGRAAACRVRRLCTVCRSPRPRARSVHEVHIDGEQMAFLEAALAAAAGRPVALFTHVPPLGSGLKVLQVPPQTGWVMVCW